MNYKEIRKIDVSEQVEKKGQFNYLSWAWAVDKLQEMDENAAWEYGEFQKFDDGTMMVYCTVKAFEKTRTAQLPVLDFKNAPIKNPNAFQINTTMQRCLAKAIALHGLGLYIYAGEDLPPEETTDTRYSKEDYDKAQELSFDIYACKTKEELNALNAWERIEELPEGLRGESNDVLDMRYKQIENGVEPMPMKWRFNGVEDAYDWFVHTAKHMPTFKTPEQLVTWQESNQPKINGLDILKAKKYQKDGKTPKERLTDKLAELLGELSQAPQAAE